jgi:hypothetical protein
MPVPRDCTILRHPPDHAKQRGDGRQPPFGRKRSWKFALVFRTCMIPRKIGRSFLRGGPGWFTGKCGSLFGPCSA